ncbi:hypothetical protein FA13DRAFT_1726199, partial [Coprinellus micaceus]
NGPTNIQGLNIVHPQIQTDSHDLLSGQPYPDLSAQLDLWTNLTFESDEPLNARPSPDDKLRDPPVTTEKAVHDGHINVVTGINLGNNHHDSAPRPHQASVPPPFDVTSFLAGFGIDPFSIPAAQPQPQPHLAVAGSTPGLPLGRQAQAHHHVPTYAHPAMPQVPAQSVELPNNSYLRNSTPAARPSVHATRKASVSAAASPEGDTGANHTSASAAEDKRRRNTAASARFRLKKKEREAALESKAKEGLRRENGWLKGLPSVNPPASLMAPSSSSSKRRRGR